jgi:uncharacterized protein (DUF2336 family)
MKSLGREQIARLYELAQERSEKSRRVLVENIADLFLSPEGRLNEHQRVLMTDLLHRLLSDMEVTVRKELAEHLNAYDGVPPDLMVMLANDSIEIARPILEKSDVLRDEDLIEIIRTRTDEHRLCIAMRDHISEAVSDALVEEGSPNVVEALLKNPHAEISKSAMAYLVAESRRVDRFQEPLLSRHDLPPELAHRMFWWVSAALRRKILTDFSHMNVAHLDQALEGATKKAIAEHNPQQGADAAALKLVEHMDEQGQLTLKFLAQALKQQKIPVFLAGLSQLSGISMTVVRRIFDDQAGDSLAVLFRAMDASREEFTSIFLFLADVRGGRKPRPLSVVREILDLYDAISVSNAKAALAYWQRDSDFQRAVNDIK